MCSRTKPRIQSRFSWNSGSVEKSHIPGSSARMRIVVVGATGNHGSSLVRRLARDPEVDAIVGIARRAPSWSVDKVSWHTADVSKPGVALEPVFRGADAVVHLAWLIQPARDERITAATNV